MISSVERTIAALADLVERDPECRPIVTRILRGHWEGLSVGQLRMLRNRLADEADVSLGPAVRQLTHLVDSAALASALDGDDEC